MRATSIADNVTPDTGGLPKAALKLLTSQCRVNSNCNRSKATLRTLVLPAIYFAAHAAVAQVYPADSFADAVGVNTHFGYPGIWTHKYESLVLSMGELGVRYYRDNIRFAVSDPSKVMSLYKEYGFRLNALVHKGDSSASHMVANLVPRWVSRISTLVDPGAIISFEGPNEYNSARARNFSWAVDARNIQAALFSAVRSKRQLRHANILAPSIWRRIEEDFSALANAGVQEFATKGNLHYYTEENVPSQFRRHASYDNGRMSDMADVIADAVGVVPGKPVWVTEIGYGYSKNLEKGAYDRAEKCVGRYLPRMLAEAFRSGKVEKMFIYNLVDDVREYGLLRADLTKRPAFYAVKHLLAALADPGRTFAPKDISLHMVSEAENLHSLTFQKRNGEYLILLWQEIAGCDTKSGTEFLVRPAKVTVALPECASGEISVLGQEEDLNAPILRYDDVQALNLHVGDEIVMLRVRLGGQFNPLSLDDKVKGATP